MSSYMTDEQGRALIMAFLRSNPTITESQTALIFAAFKTVVTQLTLFQMAMEGKLDIGLRGSEVEFRVPGTADKVTALAE